MQRIKDGFLEKLEQIISLSELSVLEIGCGNGSRSETIAKRCISLTGIEPNEDKVRMAITRGIPNAEFFTGVAEKLPFQNGSFDLVIFALSLHHVPSEGMKTAIDEAIRVTKDGCVIFLEPTEKRSFFDAEIRFDACDGDERVEKRAAHEAILSHEGLQSIAEFYDDTMLWFESVEDFVDSMEPKRGVEGVRDFLEGNDFTLLGERRVNVCKGELKKTLY